MKHNPFIRLTILICTVVCLAGCQSKRSVPNPELASIALLRGDIALCGVQQFGKVNFSLSCNFEVQEGFDLAVSLLHSFEYDDAEKAFVKVIDVDPDCAMAYWGVAMSIYHSLWDPPSAKNLAKASKILEIAQALPKTAREQDYLDAIGAYYKDWDKLDHQTRALSMEEAMEHLYQKYEDDTEAAVFYALTLNSTADPADKTYANQKKAGKLLESLFPDQPNHPGIAHYIIHNYDNPVLAYLALPTARKYAEIAPASAHAQHMPSHIFTRLGLWEESIHSNLSSVDAAKCYAEQNEMAGHWTKELHALGYLVYAYLQKGDNKNAEELLSYVKTIKVVDPEWDHRAAAYPLAAIPARIALENKNWTEAASIELHQSNVNWDDFPWQEAIVHFARALGASRIGDTEAAKKEIASLEVLHQHLLNKQEVYKANQVMIQIKASNAWRHFALGNHQKALDLMHETADMEENTEKAPVTPGEVLPAREMLGDLLLLLDEPSQALIAYEMNLEERPFRFNSIYGAAIASKNLNKSDKTIKYFETLLAMADPTSSRPEVREAEQYLKQQVENL